MSIVVALNVGFSLHPEYDAFWSLLVGSVLVLRDYAQRVWGHACLLLMGMAGMLSYLLGSPDVALASATAFAVSESLDWLIYTVTRRPFADRVLLSTAASAPVDSTVFLVLAHLFSWRLFAIGVASKVSAGLVVWAMLRWRQRNAEHGLVAATRTCSGVRADMNGGCVGALDRPRALRESTGSTPAPREP